VARRVRIGFACALCAIAACAVSGAVAAGSPPPPGGSSVPNLGWTRWLPPLPSSAEPQPGPVPNCRQPTLRCIDTEIHRLRRLRDRLGCDHRGVFATTYLVLTQTLKRTLVDDPDLFRYPRYLFTEDAVFANVYFDTFNAWSAGKPVARAWRIAFETARSGDVNAAQDMLLGINAHVQNDMPFVLASLGLRAPSGHSRKRDHDAMNQVLNQAYEPVVHAVARRYDKRVTLTNSDLTPVDDLGGLEMVRGWREGSGGMPSGSSMPAATPSVGGSRARSRANAAAWARLMSVPQEPGYRAQRDAYCRAQLGE
jgi:uncharacterized protein DUF5995